MKKRPLQVWAASAIFAITLTLSLGYYRYHWFAPVSNVLAKTPRTHHKPHRLHPKPMPQAPNQHKTPLLGMQNKNASR